MFGKYIFYDIFMLVLSGAFAVLGWKIGSVLKKAKKN